MPNNTRSLSHERDRDLHLGQERSLVDVDVQNFNFPNVNDVVLSDSVVSDIRNVGTANMSGWQGDMM